MDFAGLERTRVLDLFMEAVAKVWGPGTAAKVTVRLGEGREPGEGYASIVMSRACRPVAVPAPTGPDHLIAYCREGYTLLVSDKLLALDDAMIMRVLVHEAIHLGFPNHGADFRRLCNKHGAIVSQHGIEQGADYRIQVQRKEGARFKTFATVDTEAEGMALMKAEYSKAPGRYRLMM
ncbi:MAG: YgjP-like metallopeptidase domain-containing protein [Sphingomonas sp.]|jgi:hypothetical protein|uniref:YgjP-like metallopeptidase domain-containing protein n=1 Tax=Sphingomonas sp. TaxID=28214 RepID=UPI00356A28A2